MRRCARMARASPKWRRCGTSWSCRTPARVGGGEAVAVLSYRAWRARYGADPGIIGQRIALGRQRFEVVGVAEPHANLMNQEFVNFWAPLTMAGAFTGADPWSEPETRLLMV